jgi:DNA repair exonuclease SbcCD nuclease subunit
MEALAIGDIHLSGKNPPNRLDDIVSELQYAKLEEIVRTANDYDVPVICTGDIFHTPIVSNQILSTFGKIINKLKREFYFVLGNHDMQYHSIDMVDRTSIGVIWSHSNKIKHISSFKFHYGTNREWNYIDYGTPPKTFEGSKYLLSHKAIVSDYLVNTESWIADDENFCQAASDFEKLNLKLIICGHWHKPYSYKHKGTLIINPGPVIRRQIVERDIPRMILIDLDSIQFEEIPISIAISSEVVLRETSIKEEMKPIEERIAHFINNIKAKKQIKHGLKFKDSLKELLESKEVDPDIKAELNDIMAVIAEKKGDDLNVDG